MHRAVMKQASAAAAQEEVTHRDETLGSF